MQVQAAKLQPLNSTSKKSLQAPAAWVEISQLRNLEIYGGSSFLEVNQTQTTGALQGSCAGQRAVRRRAVPGGGQQKGRDAGSDRCQGADEFTVFRVINQITAGLRCPRSD